MRALVLLLPLLVPLVASAGERVDTYDTRGRRTGHAVVDRETGRVDYFDRSSRRTGYGRVDEHGTVETFGLDGRRQPGTVIPVPRRTR